MAETSAVTTLALEAQGETLVFFGPADASAPCVEFEVRMAPAASGPDLHFHPRQSERFTVVTGHLLATVDGQKHAAGPGEEVLVRAGQVHTFANGSQVEPLVFRCMAEPALNLQWFLTEAARSAMRTGGGSWKDASLLEVAWIMHQIPGEYRLAGMPALLQNLLIGTLARTASVLGKTKVIEPLHRVR